MQRSQLPLACLRASDQLYELFDSKTTIGRSLNCDITLGTSKSISSKHAVIELSIIATRGGNSIVEAVLHDLNSTNGTFVNTVRVHNGAYRVESGDLIRFGCDVHSYRFETGEDILQNKPRKRWDDIPENDRGRRQPDTTANAAAAGISRRNSRSRTPSPQSRRAERCPQSAMSHRESRDRREDGARRRRRPHITFRPLLTLIVRC